LQGEKIQSGQEGAKRASNVKRTRLVAGAGNIVRSADNSTMFIVTKIAIPWKSISSGIEHAHSARYPIA
jgi:hypothetical protein